MQTDCQPKDTPLSTNDPVPPVTAASVRAAIDACNQERREITNVTGVSLPMVPLPVACGREHAVMATTIDDDLTRSAGPDVPPAHIHAATDTGKPHDPREQDVIGPVCAICATPLSCGWTDTHGIGACGTCGLPYTLYHYDNETRVHKPPSIAVKESWLPLALEYWTETKRRVFPGAFDMGIFRSRGGRTYSGATEDEMREFNEWLNARKARWPAEIEAETKGIK